MLPSLTTESKMPSSSENTSYNLPATPPYAYTPTPTVTLPYNTPEPSCKTTFQHLAKTNFKPNKRIKIDISSGFPDIKPIETAAEQKQSQIDIIEESIQSPPTETDKHGQQIFIVKGDDDEKDSNKQQTTLHKLTNLKIEIPTDNASNKVSHHKKRRKSKTFKLMDPEWTPDPQTFEDATLSLHGYQKIKYIADTLQGHVIIANNISMSKTKEKMVVIKTSNKKLYEKHVTVQKHGKIYKIEEDIVKEAKLMEKFMKSQHPSSLIEYYDFFEDSINFYLVMENGGTDFFDFVCKCHEKIKQEKLAIREWRKHVKFMFAQMVLFIGWMHKIQHCCNLDISLENMLISNALKITEDSTTYKLDKCYIKFIDFGLTEYFDPTMNPCYLCNKFVGKQRYKAPEVYHPNGTFVATKADIWSLGVCLFMMIIGSPPYNKPIRDDIAYKYVINGRISDLCQSWNRLNYLTSNVLDLLTRMLCKDPTKRISIDKIMKHPWIKMYFPTENKHNPQQTKNALILKSK